MPDSEGGNAALITGASGGIGEALAHVIAADGYALALAARNEGELNRVAGHISSKGKVKVSTIGLDLSRLDACDRIAEELDRRGFVPDVVVNNAGFGLLGRAERLDRAQQINMVDVNVRTLTDLSLRYLPGMVERNTGGILNVASVAAFAPGPYMAVYYAGKNYVLAFTEALGHELAGTRVKVAALCPGPVPTGFQARAGMGELRGLFRLLKVSPQEVAEQGWKGLKEGRRVIIPGFANRMMAYGMRLSPHPVSLSVIRRTQQPHQER